MNNPPDYDPKKDAIELVSYNQEWQNMAASEIQKLHEILPKDSIIDIQHIGSTAIPGMLAKPVIDIQIAVTSLDKMKQIAIPILKKLGYEYWDENPDPERMFFVKGMPPFGEKRTHHIHVFELTSKHWQNKLIFRDYLRSHPEVIKEYEDLKIKLALEHAEDREKYTDAKKQFVDKILSLAQQDKINSSKIPIPNGELYFEETGKGKPPLILIHAGFSDRRDWTHQIREFGKEYHTIVYDQRGSGNSSIIKSGFSPADDLKEMMDHLKIEKAFLVGHSMGGTIAIDFALQYPHKVSALILVASGLNGYSWSKEYLELMKDIWSNPHPEEMTKKFLSSPLYSISMNDPNIRSEIEVITKENFQKVLTWETFDIRDVHWFFPDSMSKIKELKMPIFVIYGDKDSQDIKQIAELFAKNMENAKIMQLKNTDHLLNFEKPDELNKVILDFLREIA